MSFAQSKLPNNSPQAVILDTDMGPDYDDIGALTLLYALADSGKVNILATVACNPHPLITPILNIMNTYFKRPNLPIGVVKGRAVTMSSWQKWDSLIVARYPHDLKTN